MDSSAPRVSILLPVRDAETTLPQALDSLDGQSWTDWEVIAVDDGSRDRSAEVLQARARSDPRIRLIRTPPEGIVAALETARRAARGAILVRMDADDRASPGRLAAQVDWLERHPGTALCGTHVRYFPRPRVRGGARRYEAWLNGLRSRDDLLRDLWIECPLAHPTFALRARVLDAVGGYRDAGWPEDYDLVLRLYEAGHRFDVIPEVLHAWREGPDRLSRTDPRYAPEAFRRAKVHFLGRTLLTGGRGLVVWGAGPVGKAFARAAIAAGHPLRAFVDLDPRKVGQTIHGAPVVPPAEVGRHPEALFVAAVAQPEARAEIRAALGASGRVEGRDFVAVA